MDQAPSGPSEFRAGWRVVAAAALGVGFGVTGLPFYTFGVFVKPLAAEFNWSRAEIALGSLCLTTVTFVCAPFMGAIVDRFGARRLGLIALVGLTLGYGALAGFVDNRLSFYAAWGLTAALGAGTAAMVWTQVVSQWFQIHRGLALALTLIGTGLSGALGPPLVQAVITSQGWRAGYLAMAAVTLILVLPIVFVGFHPPAATTTMSGASDKPGFSLREAVRQVAFWRIGLGFFLVSLGIAATIVHLVPLLIDGGMAPADAAGIAGLMGLSIIIGRLTCGALVDRFDPPRVGAAFLLLPALGSVGLALSGTMGVLALPSAMLVGLAAGAEVDLVAFLTARYFGLKAFGAILGCALAMFGAGAALGPYALGLIRDATGTYALGLGVFAILHPLGAAAIFGLGPSPTLFSSPVPSSHPIHEPAAS